MSDNTETKSSTLKMRELRKSKDYLKKEAIEKILRRAKKGGVTRAKTLAKYYPHITLDKINQIRKENGFEPIDDPKYVEITTKTMQTLALEINRDTKREIERLEREKTYKLKESVSRLETEQKKMAEKYKNTMVHVPRKDLFSIEQIMNYYSKNEFRMPNGVPKSEQLMFNKYGIVVEYDYDPNDELNNQRTRNTKIVSGRWNGKGTFYTTIQAWNEECLTDFSKCLKHIDKLIDFVRNRVKPDGKPYAPTARQSMLEAVNPILKDYPAFNEKDITDLRDDAVAKIDKVLATEFKGKSDAYKIKKREEEQIDSWDTIKQEIEKVFEVGTEEYLYINVFEQVPSRDDLSNLFVYDTNETLKIEDMDDPTKLTFLKADVKRYANYGRNNAVILHRKGAIFAFYRYKTSNLYGDQFVKVDGNLRQLIDDYVSNGLIDTQLFPTRGNKMTSFVSNMLKKAGLKGDSSKNKGAINLLRKAVITKKTEELQKLSNISEEDRIALAKLMRHSVSISPTYLRKLKPKFEQLSSSEKRKLDNDADKEGLLALPAPPDSNETDINTVKKPEPPTLRRSKRQTK